MKNRLIFGSLASIVVVCFIYFAPIVWFRPIFGLTLAAVACTALWEYYKLCEAKGFKPPIVFCLIAAIFFLFIRFLQSQALLPNELATWAIGLIVFILFCDRLPRTSNAIANIATSTFGILYVVVPLSLCFDILYLFPEGRWWLVLAIGISIITDAAGYFTGKLFGRHRLAPVLSPKKTLEGAIGGVIFAVLAAWGWHALAPHTTTLIHALVIGFVLGIVGQIADLAESLLKRDAKIKDSNSIPGLGGMLDVVDSLLFNLPVVYIFLKGILR